ncbi:EAL domain-containing protein [Pseudoalteromonas fenneropenaei]|uniref:EAL domain-containing protein n=1 Tax=Pseudoalteromonas fenneropenaei TaxID=1737459 RepID=A0ABV7CPN9_9GAMM
MNSSWSLHLSSTLSRVLQSRFLLSLREAFIALIPYFVSSAIAILVLNVIRSLAILEHGSALELVLVQGAELILLLFPLMVSLSIGFYLSRNYGQSGVVGGMLALLCFVVHGGFIALQGTHYAIEYKGASAYAIIIPIISSLLLAGLVNVLPKFPFWLREVSGFLKDKLQILLPFTCVFFSFYAIEPILALLGQEIMLVITPDSETWSVVELTMQRMFLSHGAWFFGVHGDNTYNLLFDSTFLEAEILPGLTSKAFYDTFVLVGGTGCFVGLTVAAFLLPKKSHELQIAKLSLPFTLFNFCEILLFALPIFLNPLLFIPFILAPAFNFLVSYSLLSTGIVPYAGGEISWMTPVLINGWLIGQSWQAVALQLCLIACNALFYYPFLRWQQQKVNYQGSIQQLAEKLTLQEALEHGNEKDFARALSEKQKDTKSIAKTLEMLAEGEMLLYYQPQMCVKSGKLAGFEALLRLQKANGEIIPPYFLDILSSHQQAILIDRWVINRVIHDLHQFADKGLRPVLSINLNPTSLRKADIVNLICDKAKPFADQLKIEIVESSYLADKTAVNLHIKQLAAHHVATVLDDFGTGYSSLSMLSELPMNHVKLDKHFLDRCATEQGKRLYSNVVQLLHNMDYQLVAEGVERAEQLQFIAELGIAQVQGWYFAKALPLLQAIEFSLNNAEVMRDSASS